MPKLTTLTKAFSADVSVVDGERAVKAVISSSAVDRDGEVLIPMGMNSKDFEKNPIVLFGHDYYCRLPVGKIVSLKRDDATVTAKIVFAERPATHPVDEEWFPDTLLALYQQKVMNAFSVGFTITEARPATDRDMTNFGAGVRRVISKWKLMELSCVPIPCNQEAVALAVSKGIVSSAAAKGVWGIDAKEPATTGVCVECEKEFALEDMTDTDEGMVCKGCAGKKAAPAKRIIVSGVTLAEPAVPVIVYKRVVCYVPSAPPVPDYTAAVQTEVRVAVAKAQGRLYLMD